MRVPFGVHRAQVDPVDTWALRRACIWISVFARTKSGGLTPMAGSCRATSSSWSRSVEKAIKARDVRIRVGFRLDCVLSVQERGQLLIAADSCKNLPQQSYSSPCENASSRPLAAAALAIPDRAALIFSAYCSGIRVDFHPPACVIAAKSMSSSRDPAPRPPGPSVRSPPQRTVLAYRPTAPLV
jgi:hypothetical protein